MGWVAIDSVRAHLRDDTDTDKAAGLGMCCMHAGPPFLVAR